MSTVTTTTEVEPALIFKSLRIDKEYPYEAESKLSGTISFSSKHADITMHLNDEHIKHMLSIAGNALVDSAKEVADLLVRDCIIAKAEVSALEDSKCLK